MEVENRKDGGWLVKHEEVEMKQKEERRRADMRGTGEEEGKGRGGD